MVVDHRAAWGFPDSDLLQQYRTQYGWGPGGGGTLQPFFGVQFARWVAENNSLIFYQSDTDYKLLLDDSENKLLAQLKPWGCCYRTCCSALGDCRVKRPPKGLWPRGAATLGDRRGVQPSGTSRIGNRRSMNERDHCVRGTPSKATKRDHCIRVHGVHVEV